jgi:hypothetical protein
LFLEIAKRLFPKKEVYLHPILMEMLDYMIVNDDLFSKVEKQRFFCQYIETHKVLPLKVPVKVQELVESYKGEDFTQFHKEFFEIRKFFTKDDDGVTITQSYSKIYDFDLQKIAKNEKSKVLTLENNLIMGHKFLEKKATEYPDIQFFNYKWDKRLGRLYIITENIDCDFFEKMHIFTNLVKESSRQDVKLSLEDCKNLWTKADFFNGLNNNLKINTVATKKKKI